MLSKFVYASFIMIATHATHAMEQQLSLSAHAAEELASQIIEAYQTAGFLIFYRLVSSSPNVIKDPSNRILYRCITSTPESVVWHSSIAFLIKEGAPLHIQQEAELEKITAKKNVIEQSLDFHTRAVGWQQNKEIIENCRLAYDTLADASSKYKSTKPAK